MIMTYQLEQGYIYITLNVGYKQKISNSIIFVLIKISPEFTITPEHFVDKKIIPRIDKGLDNSHPGPQSHKLAAEKLYEIINESK
jgi:hypothetical protein